jgi:hypothetical protein
MEYTAGIRWLNVGNLSETMGNLSEYRITASRKG